MIRLGICGPLETIEAVAKMGFDYIEPSLTRLYELEEAEFRELRDRVQASPIRAEAFNGMLPARLRVTGPDVNAQALHEYLDKTFERARQLGGKVVVFGSSGARNVPDGFPIDVAWRQICNFLRLAERHAIDHDMTIAIEPLRRAESNIINMVSEAVALSSVLQLGHVRALADTYHMAISSEPAGVLAICASQVAHVHVANPIGRECPRPGDGEDYEKIMRALKDGGYGARMSIEAKTDPFVETGKLGFQRLDDARRAVWGEAAQETDAP